MEQKYRMRVVRGAFEDKSKLDNFRAKTIEKFERDEWESIDELIVNLDEIKVLQRNMIHHFDDKSVPWYMDGIEIDDRSSIIVAFGADDGENGKVFQFRRDDKKAVDEVVQYGISKGIPAEQMDFMDVKF